MILRVGMIVSSTSAKSIETRQRLYDKANHNRSYRYILKFK